MIPQRTICQVSPDLEIVRGSSGEGLVRTSSVLSYFPPTVTNPNTSLSQFCMAPIEDLSTTVT